MKLIGRFQAALETAVGLLKHGHYALVFVLAKLALPGQLAERRLHILALSQQLDMDLLNCQVEMVPFFQFASNVGADLSSHLVMHLENLAVERLHPLKIL